VLRAWQTVPVAPQNVARDGQTCSVSEQTLSLKYHGSAHEGSPVARLGPSETCARLETPIAADPCSRVRASVGGRCVPAV
jgi:hypothetical protein